MWKWRMETLSGTGGSTEYYNSLLDINICETKKSFIGIQNSDDKKEYWAIFYYNYT